MATQTLTFLFADIEGSTEIAQRLEDGWAGVLADHHRLIRAGLAVHGGEEVGARADVVRAVFASLRACADAGIQVQPTLVSHGWSAGARVRTRMGIDGGEKWRTVAGLAGLEVRRAALIAAVAHGG